MRYTKSYQILTWEKNVKKFARKEKMITFAARFRNSVAESSLKHRNKQQTLNSLVSRIFDEIYLFFERQIS